jgi:hypothetical protein
VTYRPPSFATLAGVTVVALVASLVMAFGRPVELTVDGARVPSDVPPVAGTAGKVYVPLRPVADALGARTTLASRGHVSVARGRHTLRVSVGDARATIDGKPVTLDHVPFRVRGRVMVELNAVARAFGVRTHYDRRTGKVSVATPGVGQAASATDAAFVQ